MGWMVRKYIGVKGFEPLHVDIKNRCLSTWLYSSPWCVCYNAKTNGGLGMRGAFLLDKSWVGVWIAQLVEQRTENPCVGGSSPPPDNIYLLLSIPLGLLVPIDDRVYG